MSLRVVASSIGANENLIKSSLSGTGTSSYEIPCAEATWRTRCAFDLGATIPAGVGLAFFIICILGEVSCRCPLSTSQYCAAVDGFWPVGDRRPGTRRQRVLSAHRRLWRRGFLAMKFKRIRYHMMFEAHHLFNYTPSSALWAFSRL